MDKETKLALIKDLITLIFVLGLLATFIVFGYTTGYQIGSALGEDLTSTIEASNEAASALTP